MGWGLWSIRETLLKILKDADLGLLLIASCISLIYLAFNSSVWGVICVAFGSRSSRIKAGMIWIESESMRWLPGGIWGYTSRIVEAQKLGLNKKKGALTLTLELCITVMSWGLIGFMGIMSSERLRYVAECYIRKFPYLKVLCIAGLIGGVVIVFMVWYKDAFSIRLKLKKVRNIISTNRSYARCCVRSLGEYLGLGFFYALGFFMCLKGIHISNTLSFIDVSGAYALSWIIGFFAFGAPGGMGVREGVLYLTFKPLGIGEEVVAGAILWRAIQILTELMLYGGVKCWRLIEKPTLSN